MLVSGQKVGRYRVHSVIGEGGMGEVYLASDTVLPRNVALKVLPDEIANDKARLSRFEREAHAVSALNHPNILTVFEFGQADGVHFLATEFVNGHTLRDEMRKGEISLSEALSIAEQTALALTAAHAAGIVHRDIKPENIMIRDDQIVKVLDFGLVKMTDIPDSSAEAKTRSQTNPGVVMGTVNYMSPEQARGDKIDARTDIFSLGVVIYEMVAGRTPFDGASAPDTIANLINKEPHPLARFSNSPPQELERIVSKMLRKNVDDRYQTAKDAMADIRALKEKLSFEEKLGRSTDESREPISEANTATFDTHHTAVRDKTAGPLSSPRVIIFAALGILLFGGAAWLWFSRHDAGAQPQDIKTLAVLPLKSLDSGENYLGLGIADAVIRKVSQTGGLTVRPTSAVRRYLQEDTDALTAGQQLNADAVLEGSVQHTDDRLRVSVNLLRTSDGTSLWSDSFDMRMTDIFTIQDTVAQQVASRLKLKLDPAQQARIAKQSTGDRIAYEFYVKGVYSFDQRGFGKSALPQMESSIELFKKAVAADPNFALAHAQLALAYAWTAQFVEPEVSSWTDLAKEEIARAQALDPQLAETHVALHYVLRSAYGGWQIESALRELLAAQQLNPNAGADQLGILYYHVGLTELGSRELLRSLDADPTSEYIKRAIVNSFDNIHRFDECLEAQRKYLGTEPRVSCMLGVGRLDEAQTRIDQALANDPADAHLRQLKATLLALRGNFAGAKAELPYIIGKLVPKDFGYHHDTYEIACVYALAGDSAEAVRWLRETAKTGFECYPLFENDAYLNPVRQAPDFKQFMTEMKAKNAVYASEFN